MTASKQTIQQWVEEGKATGATHVVIAVDTWEYENYAVYVMPGESIHAVIQRYQQSEDKIDEIYNLARDLTEQLNQKQRVWNV